MEIRPILSSLLRNKTGPLLLALQVAISLAILSNILHIVYGYVEASVRPTGMADFSTLFHIGVRNTRKGDAQEQYATRKQQLETISAVPGVKAALTSSFLPLTQDGFYQIIKADNNPNDATTYAATYNVSGSAVNTWGLKLSEGREFFANEVTEQEIFDTTPPNVVIITRSLAKAILGQESNVVGKIIYVGVDAAKLTPVRVVGVVEHLQTPHATNDRTAEFSMIFPRISSGGVEDLFSIRTEPGQRDRVIRDVEAALRAAAKAPFVMRTMTMDEVYAERYRSEKGMVITLLTISALLLLVTASGMIGLISFWVTQRRKLIGVRRALGARRIDIARYIITENVLITSAGVIVGVPLAIALNVFFVRQFEMTSLPMAYLAIGTAVFFAVGILAALAPALRAASISPAVATRSV